MKKIKITLIILVVIISLSLNGCSLLKLENKKEFEYCKSAGWDCETKKEFFEIYKPFYINNIDDILKQHALCVEKIVEENEENGEFDLYYYNDVNTIHFHFCQTTGFAFFKANYYCYSVNGADLHDYQTQRPYINFFNEIIKLYAFDVRGNENAFKDLFEESIDGRGYASNIYHFDNFCGNVGYYVGVQRDIDSYYYKLQKNSSVEILSNRFSFEGILKSQNLI